MHDMRFAHDICTDAVCLFCDAPITEGPTKNFGGSLMHAACYQAWEIPNIPMTRDNRESMTTQTGDDDMATSNDLERFLPDDGTGGPEKSHEWYEVDGFPGKLPQKAGPMKEIPVSRIPMRRPTLIKKKSKS